VHLFQVDFAALESSYFEEKWLFVFVNKKTYTQIDCLKGDMFHLLLELKALFLVAIFVTQFKIKFSYKTPLDY
jgi:hypothetical protein